MVIDALEFRDRRMVSHSLAACRLQVRAAAPLRAHVLVLFGERWSGSFRHYIFEDDGEEYVWGYAVLSAQLQRGENEVRMYSYTPDVAEALNPDARVLVVDGGLPLADHCYFAGAHGARHVFGVRREFVESWLLEATEMRDGDLVLAERTFENACTAVPAAPPAPTPRIELFPRLSRRQLAPRLRCLIGGEGGADVRCLFPRLASLLAARKPPAPAAAMLSDVEAKSLIFKPVEGRRLESCAAMTYRLSYVNNNLYEGEPLGFLLVFGHARDEEFEIYGFEHDDDIWVWSLSAFDDAPPLGKRVATPQLEGYAVPLTDKPMSLDVLVVATRAELLEDEDTFKTDWGCGAHQIAFRMSALEEIINTRDVFGMDVIRNACSLRPATKECALVRA